MQIKVKLEKEEFEPVLIELLEKALKREFTQDDVVKIMFEFSEDTAYAMNATIETRKPE